MRILSLVHGPLVRSEFYGDVVLEEGHDLEEWSVVDDAAPSRPVEDYDAVFVFGGQMNVDEEDEHPWLSSETELIRTLVRDKVPLFGVCLGGQLLAKAAGAHVGPCSERERGFVRTTLTDAAAGDPLFGALPREFEVFGMHEYAFHVPEEGVELARSAVCAQAFRLGGSAWGVQFHPEVRVEQIEEWLRRRDLPDPRAEEILAELQDRIDAWQRFGAGLCRGFLAVAQGRDTSVTVPGTAPSL